ncbi:MAG: rod-binding protein [Hyphomonadaceae bacterium]|nr:rod-binding protein [Hyphomonadaceae bacterium]
MTGPIALPGAPLPMSTSSHAAPRQSEQETALRRAAQEFESVFLSEMLAPMFEGLDTEGLGGGGMGEQIFRPMLVERYAESIGRAGGVGIADSVVREFMRMQGSQVPPDAAPAPIPTEDADGAHR